ncbi:hypothetical protein [Culturomica massiliensis]|jgi:hypothetical protein|uniref:hypothetical protein n=1 Tax=Culturomica massiliensis TaxID=1841857 RepID=UPI0012B5A5C0|nr:hypothetical protein [Culturomica massiliensis]
MAILIKTVECSRPDVAGGGVKKFYASPVHDREISLDNLTNAIEKTSTVCFPVW